MQSILHDELDIAICGEPSDPSAFYFEPLYLEKTIFVADHNHPLCQRNQVPFEELLHYPVIAGGRTCLYHLQFSQYLSRYKQSPLLLNTVNRISVIPYYVKQTLAIGVVLESTPLIPEVKRIEVKPEMPLILCSYSSEPLRRKSKKLSINLGALCAVKA